MAPSSGPAALELTRSEEGCARPSSWDAHAMGTCRPCAYFWQKDDGCRWGAGCEFCHLCDRDAIKRKKKAKRTQRKIQNALNTVKVDPVVAFRLQPPPGLCRPAGMHPPGLEGATSLPQRVDFGEYLAGLAGRGRPSWPSME